MLLISKFRNIFIKNLKKVIILSLGIIVFLSCAKTPESEKHLDFVPEVPIIHSANYFENLKDFADIMRKDDKDMRDVFNDPALTAVTTEFGFTIVKTKELPIKSGLVQAAITPWSSWWFPKKFPTLFADSSTGDLSDRKKTSTLSKYDMYRKSRVPHSKSASEFERKNYSPNVQDWEGLCDAWALASINYPEPKRPVSIKLKNDEETTLKFDVSELKGLLLKTFEAVDDKSLKYYGQKFTGQENGWIYPDIFPEQFHRFLEVQLFTNHKAFVMDTDPGVEIWNVPVFKANYTMTSLPDDPNAVFVRAWVYTAESIRNIKEKNFVGTKEVVREYDYVLQGDKNEKGELVINSGYWVKGPDGNDSRRNHPDYLILPKQNTMIRKSWNPEIDPVIVDEILKRSL